MNEASGFMERIVNFRTELAALRSGEKGPIKELNDSIDLLNYKVDDSRNKLNNIRQEIVTISGTNSEQDVMSFMMSPEFYFMNKMMNPPKDLSEDDKLKITKLENEANAISGSMIELQNTINRKKSERENILNDFDRFVNIYYYMRIFDIDLKSAQAVENFGEFIAKYDNGIAELIDEKINNAISDTTEVIEGFKTEIENLQKSNENLSSTITELKHTISLTNSETE